MTTATMLPATMTAEGVNLMNRNSLVALYDQWSIIPAYVQLLPKRTKSGLGNSSETIKARLKSLIPGAITNNLAANAGTPSTTALGNNVAGGINNVSNPVIAGQQNAIATPITNQTGGPTNIDTTASDRTEALFRELQAELTQQRQMFAAQRDTEKSHQHQMRAMQEQLTAQNADMTSRMQFFENPPTANPSGRNPWVQGQPPPTGALPLPVISQKPYYLPWDPNTPIYPPPGFNPPKGGQDKVIVENSPEPPQNKDTRKRKNGKTTNPKASAQQGNESVSSNDEDYVSPSERRSRGESGPNDDGRNPVPPLDARMFVSPHDMMARVEQLIYAESASNASCGIYSADPRFTREAQFITDLLITLKNYSSQIYRSLRSLSDADPHQNHLAAFENLLFELLANTYKSQATRNLVFRSPEEAKAVLYAEKMLPKVAAEVNKDRLSSAFSSMSTDLLKKTSRSLHVGQSGQANYQPPQPGNYAPSPAASQKQTHPICSLCARNHGGTPASCHKRCMTCKIPGLKLAKHPGACN